MNKIRLFYIKNAMLTANGIANIFGAIFVTAILSGAVRPLLPGSLVLAVQKFHIFFTAFAFVFAIIFTLLYERPIRRYLITLSKHSAMVGDLVTKARRRLLNEPFVLLAMNLGIWLTSAMVYPIFHWLLGAGPIAIQSSITNALANGLVTVTLAFFLLEQVFFSL